MNGALTQLEDITVRDGSKMYFRYYRSETNTIMILLHGISEDHKYLQPLAQFIAEENLAHVYTPDLRGYGKNANPKGDLHYIGQHDDDLADFIDWLQEKHPNSKIILAGHSAGGGTTLRFASHSYADKISGYLLLAPFVHFFAPIMKKADKEADEPKESGNKAHVGRIALLMLLNNIFIRKWNSKVVLTSNKMPDENSTRLGTLSYRLLMSRVPNNYKQALKKLKKPTLVLVGDEDEEFEYTAFEPLFTKYSSAETKVIKGADHDQVLNSDETFAAVKNWIEKVTK